MITLRQYWSTIQTRLEEKDCYTPDQFEMWIYRYKYFNEFMNLRNDCFNKLHSYPGSDEIAISYMDIGNCLGCAYKSLQLIVVNPFFLLHYPEFVIRYIIPHEYCHIMLEDYIGHSEEFFRYFEAVTGEKHPKMNQLGSRAECKYHLEVVRSFA